MKEIRFSRRDLSPWGRAQANLLGFIFLHSIWCVALIGIFAGILGFYVSFYAILLPLLLYIPIYFSGHQQQRGYPVSWLRDSVKWKPFQQMHNVQIIRTSEALDPSDTYIFGISPHGVLNLSRLALCGGVWEQLFPGIDYRALVPSLMFRLPICRELYLAMGAVDSKQATAERLLKKGTSLVIWPGGVKEVYESRLSTIFTNIVLHSRQGMFELAIRQGASLVPVAVFGERYCYKVAPLPSFFVKVFEHFSSIPFLIFWGKWLFWMPLERDIAVVFGEPIAVQQKDEPTEEDIIALQRRYMEQLRLLYDTYKGCIERCKAELLVIK